MCPSQVLAQTFRAVSQSQVQSLLLVPHSQPDAHRPGSDEHPGAFAHLSGVSMLHVIHIVPEQVSPVLQADEPKSDENATTTTARSIELRTNRRIVESVLIFIQEEVRKVGKRRDWVSPSGKSRRTGRQ